MAVGGSEMDPLPATVSSDLTDDLDPGLLELDARTPNIVDLEQGNRSTRFLAEEVASRDRLEP